VKLVPPELYFKDVIIINLCNIHLFEFVSCMNGQYGTCIRIQLSSLPLKPGEYCILLPMPVYDSVLMT
jgi:hypothetical protein